VLFTDNNYTIKDSNEDLSITKYKIDFKHLNMLMNTEYSGYYLNVSCINKAFDNFNKKNYGIY